jgi:Helix-turn-helix domain
MKYSVLNTREAQLALGISRRRLMALLAEGKLPGSYKLGLLWQIPRSAIEARRQEVAKFYAARRRVRGSGRQ